MSNSSDKSGIETTEITTTPYVSKYSGFGEDPELILIL